MSPQQYWVRGKGIPPKCKLRPWEKKLLQGKADELIETHFKPQYVQTPTNQQWNYVVGFFTHWHGAYLYFEARYACPSPDAIAPFFDHAFARLGYFADDRYSLWARRHNDQWIRFDEELITLDECFERLKQDPWFQF